MKSACAARWASLSLGLLIVGACTKADPELVRKRGEQKATIERLRGELSLLEQKMENPPRDASPELEKLRTEISETEERIQRTEAQISELEKDHRELEQELEQYKKDYPLR